MVVVAKKITAVRRVIIRSAQVLDETGMFHCQLAESLVLVPGAIRKDHHLEITILIPALIAMMAEMEQNEDPARILVGLVIVIGIRLCKLLCSIKIKRILQLNINEL